MKYLHYTIDEPIFPLTSDVLVQCNYESLDNITFHALEPEKVKGQHRIVAVFHIKLK